MSTYLYDKALLEKIQNWTSTTGLHVYGVDETRQLWETMIDDSGKDEPISFPFITLNRNLGFEIVNDGTTKRPLSYDGYTKDVNFDKKISTVINEIPVSLTYQIDVFTRYAREAEILAKNLVFNIVNYPALEIEIPKVNIPHTAVIELDDQIEDSSHISEVFVRGNFTRLTMRVVIPDAHLFDVRELHNVELDFRINDKYEL